MSNFFMDRLETFADYIVYLLIFGTVICAGFALYWIGESGEGLSGPSVALLILLVGGSNAIFIGGVLYIGLGVYQNTKRTADAIETLLTQ